MRRQRTETPLSDLIDAYVEAKDARSYACFVEAFYRARIGVIASGIPEGIAGTFVSTDEHPLSFALSTDQGGHPVMLAFADPAAFIRNFGTRFNALTTGEALLRAIVHNPECRGGRVNSAKGELSIIIDRVTAASRLARSRGEGGKRRPWWKFWVEPP